MPKIDKMLVIIFVVILAGYSVYMNIKFKDTVNQYEKDSLETSRRFEKLNEDMIREREEGARQKAAIEKALAAGEEAKVRAVKTIADAQIEAARPVVKKEMTSAVMTGEQIAKARAEKAKAEVEAMLGQVSTAPEPWEERESHL